MTSLSSLQPANRSPSAPSTNTVLSRVLPGNTEAQSSQQSAIVTVGAGNPERVPEQTYSIPRTSVASSSPVWKTNANDAISSRMAGNFFSRSLTNRFTGLGSALLDMLKNGTSNFSQSVTRSSAGSAAISSSSQQIPPFPLANEKLVVKTKSGVEVTISLSNQDDHLEVAMDSSGELGDAERAALGNLSAAFQDAIDGLSAKPPRLDLAGLTQFDPTALSSVDFHSRITLDDQASQTLDFHADATTRTLNLDGPTGMMNVSIDMHDPSIWGSSKQRADAIDSYLKQFDQAASRGNADKSLMAMFKDAFTQMNSSYAAAPQQQQLQRHPAITLADADHAMLTGLADFNASIGQVPKSPNPMHLSELDTFSYQVSQSTTVKGTNQLNRSISQQQQSHLSASYHLSLIPDVRLELTTENKSQNYYYKQIDDTANSSTEIAYTKGKLTNASSTQSASQSTHVLKYEMGKVTKDTTTPFNASLTRDILATLKPFLDDSRLQTPDDIYRWEQTLSNVHDQSFLRSNPADLHASDWKTLVQADASAAEQ
ncbi:hypothetical protein [Oxalicibacterium sp.]|uniref:hypothetical protein n=1 Tax=Oxalicibacterium sp. TaxID=2766525 RepID=UPI002D80E49D|nr:hypothetical protein [Oxalicibacterium sp.]